MAMREDLEGGDSSREAGNGVPGPSLPAHIARLINPEVLATRRAKIAERVNDQALERVRRRRCAEFITNSLLETLNDAA